MSTSEAARRAAERIGRWANSGGLVNQIKAVELSADTGITIPGLNEFMTRIKLVDTGEPPYEGLDVPFYNEDGEWVVPDGKGGYTPAQAGTTEGEER